MIGSVVESRHRLPPSCLVFLSLAAACGAWAVLDVKAALPALAGAALLGMAAVMRWLAGEEEARIEFGEESFTIWPRGASIPYAELRCVRGEPHKPGVRDYPIEVIHDAGAVRLPARLTRPAAEIEEFLRSQVPHLRLPQDVALRDHLEHMVRTFGIERVWWASGTPAPCRGRVNTGLLLTSAVLIVMSIAALMGASRLEGKNGIWAGCGIALVVGATSAFFALTSAGAPAGVKMKHRERAAVVVTPMGLAVRHGDLQGEVRWDEIRDVRFQQKSPAFVLSAEGASRAITLKMAGVTVKLLDIFDEPLEQLNERIRAYWQ